MFCIILFVFQSTMDNNSIVMDKNKINPITIRDLRPVVAIANYQDVPAGAVWGERQITDFELILVVEGRFSYEQHGARPLILEAGDVLLIPPSIPHYFRRLERPAHAVFSCIHGELIRGSRWADGDYRFTPRPKLVTHTQGDIVIHDLFKRCRDTYEGYSLYRAELLETILKEIWIRLAEYWQGKHTPLPSGRVRAMTTFLKAHLHERISRRTLARHFGVTPEHINALFRKELGVTPTQFIHRERILRAYRLLRDQGLSVKESAHQVGFEDPFYFSRIFKRILKRNPGSLSHPLQQSGRGQAAPHETTLMKKPS